MKQPDATSSENKAGPDKDLKKKAVSGPVIDSHPVSASEAGTTVPPVAKPAVESKLVGAGEGPGAAVPKPRPAEAVTPAKPAAAATKPDAAKPAPAKPEPVKPEAAKPEAAKPEPVKPAPVKPEAVKPETVKPESVKSEPARVETRVVEVRKAGFMPTLLGGVVAAGLGAAASWWAIPHLPEGWRPPMAAEAPNEAALAAARSAAIEAAQAEVQAQAETFAKRAGEAGADAARQALADVAPDPEALKAQADKLAALEKAVSELEARPAVAPVVSGDDSAGLQQLLDDVNGRLAAQQARIDELASRSAVDPALAEQMQGFAAQAETLQGQIASAAAEAEKRISAAEAQASALQDSADAANRRALGATAAAALQAAIETGGPRDQALADLQAAGVQAPAVLSGEVPTLEQLRADFPTAARDGLAASIKDLPQQGGALGAIGDFLRVQTGARSVEPREGNDPDAVLSRADAAVKAGDVKGALAQIATLPQAGQDAMSSWTGKAQVWVEANAALAALAAGSL